MDINLHNVTSIDVGDPVSYPAIPGGKAFRCVRITIVSDGKEVGIDCFMGEEEVKS